MTIWLSPVWVHESGHDYRHGLHGTGAECPASAGILCGCAGMEAVQGNSAVFYCLFADSLHGDDAGMLSVRYPDRWIFPDRARLRKHARVFSILIWRKPRLLLKTNRKVALSRKTSMGGNFRDRHISMAQQFLAFFNTVLHQILKNGFPCDFFEKSSTFFRAKKCHL